MWPSYATGLRSRTSCHRAETPLRPELPVRLLFLGWLEREKGVIELDSGMPDVLGHPGFRLRIVGDGAAAAEARELVERFGWAAWYEFRGWLRD